ncbi:MAG TPA: DMT family transporter [Cytophagaceae bacterium]|nr:DMT family transporter [Clostridiaceae bacterium]
MKIKSTFGLPASLIAIFVWGISFVSTKVVLRELPPVTIAFFRQFIALVPLLILMATNKENLKLNKGELFIMVLSSFFGIVLYFYFENKGLELTTASNASILIAALPMFALITESIIQRKRINLSSLISIFISIAGVYFIVFEGKAPDFASDSFIGCLLVFGAIISWIIYTFLSDGLGKNYSSLKMTTLQTIISIPLFIPFILGEVDQWKVPSVPAVLNLIFLGVFCSALAYVFFLFGLKTLGPVVISALLNLIPVVTIVADSVLLKEMLSIYQAIGALLILGSLTYLSVSKSKENAPG